MVQRQCSVQISCGEFLQENHQITIMNWVCVIIWIVVDEKLVHPRWEVLAFNFISIQVLW